MLLGLGLVFGLDAFALSWRQTLLFVKEAAFAPEYVYEFAFSNDSREPVFLFEVEASCGCLSVEAVPRFVPPGGKGVIRVVFVRDGRRGIQKQKVRVLASDAPDQPAVLSLVVKLPEAYTLSPQFLTWSAGEGGVQRTIFQAAPGCDVSIAGVVCDSEQFEPWLEPNDKGSSVVVAVRRRAVNAAEVASLRIRLDGPGGRETEARLPLFAH
ncbi:MAG: DUF1573 domain-containing protein [Opitutaceae bacterium]